VQLEENEDVSEPQKLLQRQLAFNSRILSAQKVSKIKDHTGIYQDVDGYLVQIERNADILKSLNLEL
jgi:hypothetical protein